MALVDCVCGICGAHYQMQPAHLRRGRGQFCSKACGGIAKRTGSTLHCAMCDTPFYRNLAEQDVGEKINQFCSRPCYDEWRVVNMSSDTYPKSGQTHQHRIVAAEVLGRQLLPSEVVHHIDLNKHNFDPANLAVFPDQSYHARCHQGGMPDDELRGFSLSQIAESPDIR